MDEPSVARSIIDSVQYYFSSYGWLILFAVIILSVLYSNLKPHFVRWKLQREEKELEARLHKNPDIIVSQMEARDRARRVLQEKYDAQAERHKEKMLEMEEQKRNQKLEHLSAVAGMAQMSSERKSRNTEQQNTTKPPSIDKSKPKFRNNDYNPLMGGGGGSGFRPGRKGPAAGGG